MAANAVHTLILVSIDLLSRRWPVSEESYDRHALGMAHPCMNANLWDEGVL